MSTPRSPSPSKLIISCIFGADIKVSKIDINAVQRKLIEEFGIIDYQSPVFEFKHTNYYEKEMGKSLQRKFIGFETLIDRELLYKVKLFTNMLENKWQKNHGRRLFNLDPGFLNPENFILATGKNFTHRIYLQKGIFAEVTLLFRDGKFNALPWTYPDYSSRDTLNMLSTLRKKLLSDLKHKGI